MIMYLEYFFFLVCKIKSQSIKSWVDEMTFDFFGFLATFSLEKNKPRKFI